ncbi:hypothetical protein CONLIGDRAFT_713191 [Coniochaeta ligniaria NRRL 30616]|uniref:HMG box domain-containing protein n=1 Tax=Coniochaeta ligniaria NRRL 30616 TaxID=1408157 RepID=A0A1J7JBB5_9PEZI|nr:hypothetical protein CONLIGDRAFT_713191 [Coniochaeta ligniaria NRRL 30616]
MASIPERRLAFVIGVPVGTLDRTKAASICQKMSDRYGQCAAIWLNEKLQRYELHIPIGDVTRAGLVCYCVGLSNDHGLNSDQTSPTPAESTTQTGHVNNDSKIPDMAPKPQAASPVHNNRSVRTIRDRRPNRPIVTGHIPRPRNSWIIYRSDKTRELRDMNPSLTASDISRITSRLWAEELDHIKVEYQQRAQEEANQHTAMYPNYRYRARRPNPRHPTVDAPMFWHGLPNSDATDDEDHQSGTK